MYRVPAGQDPYGDDTGSLFGSISHAVSHAAKGVVKTAKGGAHLVSGAAKGATKVVHSGQSLLKRVPVVGTALSAVSTIALSPYEVSANLLSGQRIDHAVINHFKSQLAAIKDVAPYVQTIISFVPGVGQGISGAMGAALALAQGKPISEAMIQAARGSLPGGPLAAAAFDAATAAIQGKGLSEIALAAVPLPPAQKDILRQSLIVAKDLASGKRVDKILLDRVNSNLDKLPASVRQATQVGVALAQGQNIQKTLIKAGSSVVSKNMNFSDLKKYASAAHGATPGAIKKAMGASQAIAAGSPVLRKALTSAVSHYPTGSLEHLGFKTAIETLRKTSGNKMALAAARRALPTEAARQAFDSAIGTVSHTVSQHPGSLAKRAGSIFVPKMSKEKGVISPYQPNLKNAIDSIKRNPTLAAQHPMVLANKFGTTQQTVLQALRHVGTQRLLPWRSMSPNAARFIRKWHPNAPLQALTHGTNDTAGLDESGTKYIVEKGDSPFKIAQKLTGNGNRWAELKSLNTDKKPDITKNVWVGEVLNLPASWQKPTAKQAPSPGPAQPTQPSIDRPAVIVTPAPQISVAPGILQAKAILVAWSKTDGINQAGIPDYGSTAADLSTDFGSRDSTELMSFQNWSNKTGNASTLVVDGKLGPKSMAALQHWAETRANSAAPVSPTVSSSIPGQVTTLPEVVITATPPVSSPGIPQLPPAPVVVAPSIPLPPVPVIAPPSAPATPATVAANAPAAGGSKLTPMLGGAAIGGVLFGLPGAIIGGIAGAAIS